MAKKSTKPTDTPPDTTKAAQATPADAPSVDPPSEGVNSGAFSTEERPAQIPPEESFGNDQEAFGSGTWHNGKKITSLYGTDGARNSWAYISGMGWKKFEPDHNSAVAAFTIVAGMAENKNRTVNIKLENNRITEMYVW
ncbi:hypothetical protein HZ996_09060 [Cryomorphaceae bacterium]|nr:hypothetical protein HZ996_09060 [Cryomorphaceae bacterium]